MRYIVSKKVHKILKFARWDPNCRGFCAKIFCDVAKMRNWNCTPSLHLQGRLTPACTPPSMSKQEKNQSGTVWNTPPPPPRPPLPCIHCSQKI